MIPDRTEFHWDTCVMVYVVHQVKDGMVTTKLSIPRDYHSRIPKVDVRPQWYDRRRQSRIPKIDTRRKERHVQNSTH